MSILDINKKIWPILAVFFVCTGLFLTSKADAGVGILKVSPAVIEENLSPRDTATSTVHLTNISESEQEVRMQVIDIAGFGEDGRPLFSDQDNYLGASWVETGVRKFSLKVGEERDIQLSVMVPGDVPYGKYLILVAFSQSEDFLADKYYVGAILALNIVGNKNDELTLNNFSLSKTVYSDQPIAFDLQLENIGNSVLRPQGSVVLTNWSGEELRVEHLNQEATALLPGKTQGISKVIQNHDLSMGRYQLVLSLLYGESKKTLVSTLSFWVIPFKTILVTCLSIVLLLLLLYLGVIFYTKSKDSTQRSDSKQASKELRFAFKKLVILTAAVLVIIMVLLSLMYLYL